MSPLETIIGTRAISPGRFLPSLTPSSNCCQRRLPVCVPWWGLPMTTRAAKAWESVQPVSIDVGIMEKAQHVAIVPASMGWSDVGSWSAIGELSEKDAEGNVILGGATLVALDGSRHLVSASKKLIATIGMQDLVVVETDDALLIMPRARAQDVSKLVKHLRALGLDRYV